MKNNKLITIILFLSLIIVIIFLIPKSGNKMTNPLGRFIQNQPLPGPEVSNYNPPKEIKYDQSTDLKQELDNINPKVLDSDFDSLKNL